MKIFAVLLGGFLAAGCAATTTQRLHLPPLEAVAHVDLARYLGTSAELRLGLQLEYDLRVARQAKQKDIERAVHPRSEAA